MRRRLLVTVLVLVAMVLVGLGVPLAISDARTATQRQFADRLADTVRFASLSQRPIIDGDAASLLSEIRRYDEVYGIGVELVGRDGQSVAVSRPRLYLGDTDRVRVALAGRGSEPYPVLMPWDTEPMVLAEPVLVDGEVRGAVATVSPTDGLRRRLATEWLVLLVAGLLALVLAAGAALPVVRWIMRPVQRLDSGLARAAAAVLSGGPAEPVADGRGPPELLRLATSFDRMVGTVSQSMAAQRAFVADASHQLRNPLTALRLRLDNLDPGPDPEQHHAALEEAERLGELLDGLLALARAERPVTELTVVGLDEVLADRIEAWRVLAEHLGLRLLRCGPTGLRALAPPGTVESVLDALLDNAVKFSPAGAEITVGTATAGTGAGAEVLLVVRDHGPGLAVEELERATDRFWRSPAHHNLEGSGLGLAIAARMLRRCEGELTLELPDDGGLRVVVRLPSAPGEEVPALDAG
jgi:signal transduction histidine kinase